MRISNLHIYNLANQSMSDANKAINRTQEELSTGQRVLSSADDPVAATRIQQLTNTLAIVEQYEKNITIAENNLALQESSLSSVMNLIQRVEELAIQAGNTATLSESEYQALASEVKTRVDEMFNLANTRNATGDYIFAGYKSSTPPFVGDIFSGYRYEGNDGQLKIKIDNNTTIAASDSGKAIFVDIPSNHNTIITTANSNNRESPAGKITSGDIVDQELYDEFYPEDMVITFNDETAIAPPGKNFTVTERSTGKVIEANHRYSAGEELVYNGISIRITGSPASADAGLGVNGDQYFINSAGTENVLTTMNRFHDAMENYNGSTESLESLQTVIANTIANLSNAQDTVSSTITKIGARMNSLESTRALHIDTQFVSNEILSDLRDTDYAEASTRLSAQTLVLQAAQASFLRITELNLFSRL